jgi:hypothetical protein
MKGVTVSISVTITVVLTTAAAALFLLGWDPSPDVALADHEAFYRDLGVGFNDYDDDGRTCAATDEEADAWSDAFYNHHEISDARIAHFESCEAKEASYAGLPPDADNRDHIQDLIDQWDSMYGLGSGWAESFGD